MRPLILAAMLVASGAAWSAGCYPAAPNPGYDDGTRGRNWPCGTSDQWTGDHGETCCPPGYFHTYSWQKVGDWTNQGGGYGFDDPVLPPDACPAVPGHFSELSYGRDCKASHPGRTYTLAEIDRMRKAVWELLAHCSQWQHEGICYAADPATIEDRLRTYIAAGISPEALEAEAKTADH